MAVTLKRSILVTLGLSCAGAFFGALAFTVACVFLELMVVLASGGFEEYFADEHVGFAGIPIAGLLFGGPLGAILAPLAGWSVLRRAPFGIAFAWLTVGAVIGGVFPVAAGELGGVSWARHPLVSAAGGFLIAAALLSRQYRARAGS